jgi:hypothetical protein
MFKFLVVFALIFVAAFADNMFDMSMPKRGIETERDRTIGKAIFSPTLAYLFSFSGKFPPLKKLILELGALSHLKLSN